MIRIIWQARYALIALRSRYEITAREAWSDAAHAWEDTAEGGKMTPADTFREDSYEWRFG